MGGERIAPIPGDAVYGGGVPGTLRLADLLGGLSMVADYGFGLPPGTAVRTGLVAAALGRRMGLADGEVRLLRPPAGRRPGTRRTSRRATSVLAPLAPLVGLHHKRLVPAFQGRGIGSVLLRDMLARADADGRLAYHEATSPRNRALYVRHGYVDLGELVVPDGGPTLWRMWRDPR